MDQARCLQVLLPVDLDVIYLEGRVGAVKLVVGAAAALELVDTFPRDGRLGNALKLDQLFFARE